MKFYTKEQFEILSKYERIFNTVVNLNYIRTTNCKQNDEVTRIYEEASGNKVIKNWSCSKCVYNLFHDAGVMYYATKQQMEIQDVEDTDIKKDIAETEVHDGIDNVLNINKKSKKSNKYAKKKEG